MEVRELLKGRDYVLCKVIVKASMFNGYYSKPMLVPAADIIHEVHKEAVESARESGG